jgi:hypothetical protein
MEMKKLQKESIYQKTIGRAFARIAAEIRDSKMAPDALRKQVLDKYAAEIAETRKRGDGWFFGPDIMSRAARRELTADGMEYYIREKLECPVEKTDEPQGPEDIVKNMWHKDFLPIHISWDIRRLRLERVISEEAAIGMHSMLMRRLKTLISGAGAFREHPDSYAVYQWAAEPEWESFSPYQAAIQTMWEILHLAKKRGWADKRLEAREKLAEIKRWEKEWRKTGGIYMQCIQRLDKVRDSLRSSSQFKFEGIRGCIISKVDVKAAEP